MNRIVVHASVAVKWVLHEEHWITARRLLSNSRLLAPHLLWAEVGNILWKRYRRHEASVEEVRQMLADVGELPVTTFAHWPLLSDRWTWASRSTRPSMTAFILRLPSPGVASW